MTSGFRQYIAEYTVANLLSYSIRRRVAFARALESILLVPWSEKNEFVKGSFISLFKYIFNMC